MRVVARWETKGKDFLQLEESNGVYFYTGRECGGTLGKFECDEDAIVKMSIPVETLKSDRKSLRRVK